MPRVLIVDDHAPLLEMLSGIIRRMGHEVLQASNGIEATAAFQTIPPNLLLTDLLMPEQDGFEIIRYARKRHPSVRIIAMSGGGKIDAGKYLDVAEQLGASHTL